MKPFIIFDAFTTEVVGDNDSEASSFVDYLTQYEENLSPLYDDDSSEPLVTEAGGAYNVPPQNLNNKEEIKNCNYLAIVVDKYDNYFAFVGKDTGGTITWHIPKEGVNVNQFKGLDMWIKFNGINELIYFLLTKYEKDIISIETTHMTSPSESTTAKVDVGETIMELYDEQKKYNGRLWCYINPRTMKPYLDEYWFHENEPYYIKSLDLADKEEQFDAKKITIQADVWPGAYMLVGETYIRNRDTMEDEHMQIIIPQAKVKSEQSFTLQADGEPTVFNLNLEVAQPKSKILMEINTYKTKKRLIEEENGNFVIADGSDEVVLM